MDGQNVAAVIAGIIVILVGILTIVGRAALAREIGAFQRQSMGRAGRRVARESSPTLYGVVGVIAVLLGCMGIYLGLFTKLAAPGTPRGELGSMSSDPGQIGLISLDASSRAPE